VIFVSFGKIPLGKDNMDGYIMKKLKSEKSVDLHNIDTIQDYLEKEKVYS